MKNTLDNKNNNKERKWLKIAVFIVILFIYSVYLAHKIELPLADDLARHIKNGELIVRGNFEALYSNVYSYTEPEHEFVNHHWLSGVVFYILHQIIGWGGLVVFKIVVLLSTFALLFLTALKKSNFWLASAFSLFAVIILGGRTPLRPEIFSYLFIAIFLYVLNHARENPDDKKIFWLIPAQLLWVNMHIFFVIGPIMVAGFLFEKVIFDIRSLGKNTLVKRLFVLLILLVAVSLMNPNGFAGATYPLRIFGDYGMDVSENNSVMYFFRINPPYENIDRFAFLVAAGFLAISFMLNIKNKPVFYFMAASATAFLGFNMIRNLPLFALIFLPAISANSYPVFARLENMVRDKPTSRQNIKCIFGAALAAAIVFAVYLAWSPTLNPHRKAGLGLVRGSNGAAEFLRQSGLRGPIFNDYNIGSYLIYHFYPEEKVFVDNRPEAYSKDFFENTYLPMLGDEEKWLEELQKNQFNMIFLYRYSKGPNIGQFYYRRANDPEWALVYADQHAVIFARRNDLNGGVIKQFEITRENAEEKFDYLAKSEDYDEKVAAADNFNLVGRDDLSREIFFQVVARWPYRGRIWMVMGEREYMNLNENSKNILLAVAYLERALAEGYRTAEVHSFLGGAYLWLGFEEKAREHLNKASKINPFREDAKELLDLLNKK